MLTFDEALRRLLGQVVPLGAERVGLDVAAGRVLAEAITTSAPIPAFDQSSMDGFALASGDLTGEPPFRLEVRGASAAGSIQADLVRGTAMRILTGAPLPVGADAVLLQEDVTREGDSISFGARPSPGSWIRRRGSEARGGERVLSRGQRLGPGQVAMVAACDRPHVLVARQPVVTILGSGDELRSPGEPDRPGSIPESNGYFIAAAARRAGAVARIAPFVRDDAHAAETALRQAIRSSDLVVTVGGMSVGDHDVMRDAMVAAGAALDFWKVAIKPGKPLAVGHAGATHVLGLPGNPASAAVTFLLFGVPLCRALQGDTRPLPPREAMEIDGALERSPGRQEFLRATLVREAGRTRAGLISQQSSGAPIGFALAEALVVVPAERTRLSAGDVLDVIRLSDIWG